jgi:hypothetical protein
MWDEWDDLNMVMKCDKVSQEDKNHARLLISQLKFGDDMSKELTYFLEDMANKYGTILAKFALEYRIKNLTAGMNVCKAFWEKNNKCHHIMFSELMHKYSAQISALKKQLDKY